MKFLTIVFIIMLTLFSTFKAIAQSNVTNATFQDGKVNLRKFLLQKLDEQRKSNNDALSVCYTSATFAKFTIDAEGKISNLTFSELTDTPPVFRQILKNIVNSTDNLWTPATENGKPIKSKPFILPFIYQMESACSLQHPSVNGADNALTQLFNFSDDTKIKDQVDCIILKPITIFSQK